jgi:uncharacterized protein
VAWNRRHVFALVISLAMLVVPSAAVAMQGPTVDLVVIPASAFNPQTIEIPASALFIEPGADFFLEDDGTMYVQTGDIPAMWLRDSSAQTKTYVRFITESPRLGPLVRAVVERNAKNVLSDPYANAFTAGFKVWEEKWEPDSLAYPVTLAYTYWRRTSDRRLFTPRLHWALVHSLSTLACEQHHMACSHYTSRFLSNGGRGADFKYTGMIWSAFRPSDDPVRYPYNIPQQMFVVVALHEMAELLNEGYRDSRFAGEATQMASEIDDGIARYGVVYEFGYGWIYAYEVDGLGQTLLIDDANLPNLLASSYFGYALPETALYANTRRFVLSMENPYFYAGKYAAGLGSPHTPTGWVWPLGIIAQGLTAMTSADAAHAIALVNSTNRNGGRIHESFDPDDPDRFTRSAFGWADSMYAELVFRSAAGFDPDPLPVPPQASMEDEIQRTPLTVSAPQLWLNADACLTELRHVLQE